MTLDQFIQELEASLSGAEAGQLKPETRFRDLSWWDSLAVLGTLAVFDGCFGRQLTAQQLEGCQTIGDIYRLGAST